MMKNKERSDLWHDITLLTNGDQLRLLQCHEYPNGRKVFRETVVIKEFIDPDGQALSELARIILK